MSFPDPFALRAPAIQLPQAMIMGALGNVVGGDVIRSHFATGPVRRVLEPLLSMEQFGASPSA